LALTNLNPSSHLDSSCKYVIKVRCAKRENNKNGIITRNHDLLFRDLVITTRELAHNLALTNLTLVWKLVVSNMWCMVQTVFFTIIYINLHKSLYDFIWSFLFSFSTLESLDQPLVQDNSKRYLRCDRKSRLYTLRDRRIRPHILI
jgi:hypothetical protein